MPHELPPASSNLTRAEMTPHMRSKFEMLEAQMQSIFVKYGASGWEDFVEHAQERKVPDADIKTVLDLSERMKRITAGTEAQPEMFKVGEKEFPVTTVTIGGMTVEEYEDELRKQDIVVTPEATDLMHVMQMKESPRQARLVILKVSDLGFDKE